MKEKIVAISVKSVILTVIKDVLRGTARVINLDTEFNKNKTILVNNDLQFFFIGCDYKYQLHPLLKKFVFLCENKQIPFIIIWPMLLKMKNRPRGLFFFALYEDYSLSALQEKILQRIKISVNHSFFSGKLGHSSDPIYKILDVQRKLVSNPHKRESLLQLASKVGLSPSWLSFKFKDISGMSLESFLLRTRLCYSLWQIISTPKLIKTIALEQGYKPLSFTKRFHKVFGMSPSAVRNELSSFPN